MCVTTSFIPVNTPSIKSIKVTINHCWFIHDVTFTGKYVLHYYFLYLHVTVAHLYNPITILWWRSLSFTLTLQLLKGESLKMCALCENQTLNEAAFYPWFSNVQISQYSLQHNSRTSKTGREYGVNYFIVEMNVSLLYIIVHQYIFIGIIICSPWKLFAVNTSSAQGLVLCLKLEQNKKREKNQTESIPLCSSSSRLSGLRASCRIRAEPLIFSGIPS